MLSHQPESFLAIRRPCEREGQQLGDKAGRRSVRAHEIKASPKAVFSPFWTPGCRNLADKLAAHSTWIEAKS